MKIVQLSTLLAVGLALTCIVATGCKRKPGLVTPLPNGARAGATTIPEPPPGGILQGGPTTGGNPTETSLSPDKSFPQGPGHPGWNNDGGEMFKSDTVYFDFDSSAIKDSEKSKIDNVATYLKSNPANAVQIEGHCDERGTEEYNRALGERRALAVREQLIGAGIAPDRLDTITYGKDRPADPGHNEAAWRKNRRGVFDLLTPPK